MSRPENGVSIVSVQDDVVVTIKAATFRMRMTNRFSPLEPWPTAEFRNTPARYIGRFAGTIH